ncbi:GspE/PulE family protein [Sporomusa sphaeroides]|uniref:Type II secretion system protein E n=1 Tax=Sporomusa sphaeroides DSM 2875 TaxID=1337886 RepID=A0A1U7M9Q8_9FIRM|nr:ATPase, T2SS/T4P/T4SS family [Sporomusa sphaeroides]OLS54291.1 type II secretion system protein E [Sporomusa sphaeroides DSM 2875]CVK21671.1 Type II secretion system protein E [Sporomusa sphaeroides DSM 2875]
MDNKFIEIPDLSDLTKIDIPQDIIDLVDKSIVNDFHVFPVMIYQRRHDLHSTLILATSKYTENLKCIPILENLLGLPIILKEVKRDVLEKAAYYYLDLQIKYAGTSLTVKGMAEIEREDINASKALEDTGSPTVHKVNALIQEAIRTGASDIHIDPWDNTSKVEFRINGDIIDVSDRYYISKQEKGSVINIIKNMCKPGLNITLKHMEQKGQFFIEDHDNKGKYYDCRVATIPSIRQEKITIRILDPAKIVLSLEDLGYELSDLIRYRKRYKRKSGLILYVAPTGGGKTTGMYATLEACGIKENKIFAIEDPPEYRVEGIVQIPIREHEDESKSWTYLKAIKATLRNDLNILLIGEIRSAKEAEAVLEGSKTGHLVLTTLHARDSIMAIPRLFTMGIDRKIILSEMLCIVAQRLIKVNCPHCSEAYEPTEAALIHLTSKEKEKVFNGTPKRSKGCPRCSEYGRKALAEFLFFDNELRDYMAGERGIVEMMEYLKQEKGFVSMWEKGIDMVAEGEISLENLVKELDRNEDDNEELRAIREQTKAG